MRAIGEFLCEVRKDFNVVSLDVDRARFVPLTLARYLRSARPSALIANMWPLTSGAVVGRALSGHSCTLLLVEHTTLSPSYASWGKLHNLGMRASLRLTYRWADHVASVSQGSARDLAKLAGLPAQDVTVLYNPIPKRPEPSPDARARVEALWQCGREERFLTVGTLKDAKNHPLLLRAFAALARASARLMFVGKGENEPMMRALAADLGIADRVIFAGFYDDPSPFYATADVFVLSSDYEGFGNVIVEALSVGLPVVSTDCPSGPAEILENGRWGHLVPVGDVDALSRVMEEALSREVDREALKRRAADFSPEIAARKYLSLLGLE